MKNVKMRMYEVVLDDNKEETLFFIAMDRDHLVTLLTQTFPEEEPKALLSRANVTQVAGPKGPDVAEFWNSYLSRES